jgi:hypothetical protein
MKYNIAEKIFYNPDLMYIIYQYDYTYLKKHKELIKDSLLLICEKAHFFWYEKYEKALNNNTDFKEILQLQDAFFDTLDLLGYEFIYTMV